MKFLIGVASPDHRMQNDFSPHIPYTLRYSATSKSTDSLVYFPGSHLTSLLLVRTTTMFFRHVLV